MGFGRTLLCMTDPLHAVDWPPCHVCCWHCLQVPVVQQARPPAPPASFKSAATAAVSSHRLWCAPAAGRRCTARRWGDWGVLLAGGVLPVVVKCILCELLKGGAVREGCALLAGDLHLCYMVWHKSRANQQGGLMLLWPPPTCNHILPTQVPKCPLVAHSLPVCTGVPVATLARAQESMQGIEGSGSSRG